MSNKSTIEHPGVVAEVKPGELKVRILSKSACASCHAKGACSMADMAEKMIDVSDKDATEYSPGQQVNVVMRMSAGNRAVILGYFIPLLVLVAALILSLAITANEGLSGIIAIAVLIPYYLGLWLLRDRIKKNTEFSVHPL